ncbi:hypothetical protein DUI87_30784 [Hirundo rustica rustica]|uniref:Uncharacterized protein n=1 Tax=Hirundo rustica rustica TaxID=333673 RepID=A0A3M0IY56_HIRRU|nr:hypothetical protein DUI87_30784 [Hirundo rustica rustica]
MAALCLPGPGRGVRREVGRATAPLGGAEEHPTHPGVWGISVPAPLPAFSRRADPRGESGKKKKWPGKGGYADIRKHFPGKNILLIDPGVKNNTAQGKRRDDAKKGGVAYGEEYRPPKIPKALRPIFFNSLKEQIAHDN